MNFLDTIKNFFFWSSGTDNYEREDRRIRGVSQKARLSSQKSNLVQ